MTTSTHFLTMDTHPYLLKGRERPFVNAFKTGRVRPLAESDKILISAHIHIWKMGDRLYKLSKMYYGTHDEWYIIALHNNKPTEAHIQEGDELSIPMPLYLAKSLYGL